MSLKIVLTRPDTSQMPVKLAVHIIGRIIHYTQISEAGRGEEDWRGVKLATSAPLPGSSSGGKKCRPISLGIILPARML